MRRGVGGIVGLLNSRAIRYPRESGDEIALRVQFKMWD